MSPKWKVFSREPRDARLVWVLACLALVLPLAVFACGGSESAAPQGTANQESSYQTVTVEELAAALHDNPEVQLVDVREPSEWRATGVIAQAKLIPLGNLESLAPKELDKERPVYVVCRSGNRSRTGAEILVGLGFTEVYSVAGGILEWIEAGQPVIPHGG